MKTKIYNFFQTLSKAFLMPIALLSIASILLGVSSIFLWHDAIKEAFPIITSTPVAYVATLMSAAADVIMGNLPILFAVSLAFAIAEEDKEYAAFGAMIAYLAFNASMALLISSFDTIGAMFPEGSISTILGTDTLNTGVLGGIVVGLISGYLHGWAKKVKFPMAFAFFGGLRFVPTANALFFILLGQVFPFLWIPISNSIFVIAESVANSGIFAPFLYGFGERLLIPTGLHHIWNTVIRDTAVSGTFTYMVDGSSTIIEGGRPAFNEFLKLGVEPNEGISEAVKFLRAGQIPFTVFALPAMGMAMLHTAKEENKKMVKPLIMGGIFTSIFAGVTEPLEFAFMFAAPLFYLFYSFLNGLTFMVTYLLGNTMGGTEASIIGIVLYGFLQENSTWLIPCIIGVVTSLVMYPLTKFCILKFDIKTPGRGDEIIDDSIINVKGSGEDILTQKAYLIIDALGGPENIVTVECCFTRLRVKINDNELVSEELINKTGNMGIVRPDDNNIQIIYGASVNMIKEKVVKTLKKAK